MTAQFFLRFERLTPVTRRSPLALGAEKKPMAFKDRRLQTFGVFWDSGFAWVKLSAHLSKEEIRFMRVIGVIRVPCKRVDPNKSFGTLVVRHL